MKRIIGLLALAALLLSPSLAPAAEKIGVYITPKFVYGYLPGYDAKQKWDGGYNRKMEMSGDDLLGGALAVGYDFSKRFGVPARLELEYAMFGDAKGDDKQGGDKFGLKIGIQTLFVNAYYDFRNASAFTPYLGLGLGVSFVDAKGKINWSSGALPWDYSIGKDSRTNFAWNLSAGVSYAFTDYISLDLGYRFVSLGEAETKTSPGAMSYTDYVKFETKDLYTHQFALGLRVTF